MTSTSIALLRGIEAGGRLIQQDDVRFHRQDGGDGDALLLAATQLIRRAIGQMGDVHLLQRDAHARRGLPRRPTHLQRAKRDVVVDRRAEELDVGILEDQSDTAVQFARAVRIVRHIGDVFVEGVDAALVGR